MECACRLFLAMPVSPLINTVIDERADLRKVSNNTRMDGDLPRIMGALMVGCAFDSD